MPARVRWRRALVFNAFLVSAAAGAQPMRVADIADLSIEELSNIQITSVSRHAERLSDAPAAIFVITGEDIRRSGATRLSEALRLAPNLEVARSSASSYAISARGFNNMIANKLLVLIDGRTVYTPLFSGVFWDAQDTLLEDVDRIEVISGPGATLWGANAVNGVINVITKDAGDTQGGLLSGGGGTELRGFGTARYGGRLGSAAHYRLYGKGFARDESALPDGQGASDDWHAWQGGYRVDWDPSTATHATVHGDLYDGRIGQPAAADIAVSGRNIVGRWTHTVS